MIKLLRPTWMSDQEWLVAKIGVLYLGAIAFMLFLWWKGYLKDIPK